MLTRKLYLIEGRTDVSLTTYVLDDSKEMLNGRKRPAVLICPGGAYLNCSDREGEPVAMRFASMGYHAFVLRYSVYTGKNPEFNPWAGGGAMPVNEDSIHPAPMRDIARAFLTIREHADEWLVDVDRIAICGFSAGAHNCAMYSVYWQTPLIGEYFGKAPEMFKPAATILAYTLSDYVYMRELLPLMDEMGKGLFHMANIAFTGVPEPDEATLHAISPARLVSEHTPPMFLWSTAADSLVPIEHSLRMAQGLAQKNIPFEMHIFEEGPHGLSLADQSTASVQSYIDPNAAKWAGLVEAWLLKRFAIEFPAKNIWDR